MNVCPVLVGREPEVAALTAALGRGGLVLVAGEAGIGKSRLLRELESVAVGLGHRVVWGRPEVVTAPGPYSVVVDLLDDVASIAGEGAKEATELATALGALSGGGGEPPARQIATRVRGLLSQLGAGPVILIEDLHAADELSQAVIAHLARAAADDRVLVVGTYRPEESSAGTLARLLDVLHRDRLVTRVDLQPLSADALGEMVRAMWGTEPTQGDLDEISRLGEGVPLFIEELANAKADGAGAVPTSISWGVNARLARLDDASRAVMRVASLMTGALDPAVLADVCEQPPASIPHALVEGVAAGLLADREGRLVFRHALVRETIADSIVSVERSQLHARLAAAIERVHTPHLEPHAARLARHYVESGRAADASRWWLVAARRALEAGALEEARVLLEDASRHATGAVAADVMIVEGDLSARLGNLQSAIESYGQVVDHYRRSGALDGVVDVLIKLARAMYVVSASNHPRSFELLDEALALPALDPLLRAKTLVNQGVLMTRDGRVQDGEVALAEGLRAAEALGDVQLLAEAHAGLSWAAEFRLQPEQARELGRRACDLALRSGSDELIGRTHVDHALQLALRGHGERALDVLETARTHLAGSFGGTAVAVCDHNTAWVLWRMGRPAEAEAVSTRLETTRFARQYGRVVRAWAACERGNIELADAIVTGWWEEMGGEGFRFDCRRDPASIPEPSDEPVLAVFADLMVQIAAGRVTAELLEDAGAYAQLCREGSGDIVCLGSMLYARALCAAGDFAGAIAELDEIESVAAEYPYHRAARIELRAAAAPDPDGFMHAAEAYRGADNSSDQARCWRLLGARRKEEGNADQAIAALKEGFALSRASGATAEMNRAEAALRELGVRPRAGRPKGSGTKQGSLSDREQEVVGLLAAGSTNAEISARLFLSERTVRDHIASAQRRLGVTSRPGLVAWAIKQGIV